ncbi:methyltransferase [Stutzerimonas marianensis]
MPTSAPRHAQLAHRFRALDTFLIEHQALWRPRPFTEHHMAWEDDHPELAAWLRARSLEQAEAIHNDPAELNAPAPFPELAAQASVLSHVEPLPKRQLSEPDPRQSVDVPGRKWQQIREFSAVLRFSESPDHWIDWCSGKGHLGRHLVGEGGALTCLEWDPQLVDAGHQLSRRLGIDARHLQQDVMDEDAAQHLAPATTPAALHACGDLHVRLLQLSTERGCRRLAVAPCCYNRTWAEHYQPLSALAKQSTLILSRDDLGLPLSETVTAGTRERRQRDQSMAWRLAFDLLQRQVRGVDSYLPTPSLPGAWLKKPFADYCQDLATLKAMPALPDLDWARLEQRGWQRLAEVRNLELVRGLFRRPLELWLLLDRALFLSEQGYQVRLGTFCPSSLTPRNLMLLAERDETR